MPLRRPINTSTTVTTTSQQNPQNQSRDIDDNDLPMSSPSLYSGFDFRQPNHGDGLIPNEHHMRLRKKLQEIRTLSRKTKKKTTKKKTQKTKKTKKH
jgi:hypothetical protein